MACAAEYRYLNRTSLSISGGFGGSIGIHLAAAIQTGQGGKQLEAAGRSKGLEVRLAAEVVPYGSVISKFAAKDADAAAS